MGKENDYGHANFIEKAGKIAGNVFSVNSEEALKMVDGLRSEFGDKILESLKPELRDAYEHGKGK